MTHEKVFRCTSCQGIYLDQPVSQCDCMGGPTHGAEFAEWRLVSVEESEFLKNVKALAVELSARDQSIINLKAPDVCQS